MSGRGRQGHRAQGRQAAPASRRRWGWAAAGTAVLAIAGIVVGLHVANAPAAAPGNTGPSGGTAPATVGHQAPDGTFTALSGQNVSVTSLRGKPTLLWFVSTWCSSCQAGTSAMAHDLAELKAAGVRVDEVELYRDLGQSGPSMAYFASTLAGVGHGNPDWTFGTSSAPLTRAYDPNSYLDVYYLINSAGKVSYINSSPGSTMPQLLAAAKNLS